MIRTRKNQMNSLISDKKPHTTDGKQEHQFEKSKTADMGKPVEKPLDEKSLHFRNYYMNKARKIFQPDLYEYYLHGEVPTESPLIAGLQDEGKTSYVSPLPAAAYERKIDVDRKYVREERPALGLQ
jgi:hypothetical protein